MQNLLKDHKPHDMSDEDFLRECIKVFALASRVNDIIRQHCPSPPPVCRTPPRRKSPRAPSISLHGGARATSPQPIHMPSPAAAAADAEQLFQDIEDVEDVQEHNSGIASYAIKAVSITSTVFSQVYAQVHGVLTTRIVLLRHSILGRIICNKIFGIGSANAVSFRDVIFILIYIASIIFIVKYLWDSFFSVDSNDRMYAHKRQGITDDAWRLAHTLGEWLPTGVENYLGVDKNKGCIRPSVAVEVAGQVFNKDFTNPLDIIWGMFGYVSSIFSSPAAASIQVDNALENQMTDMPFCKLYYRFHLHIINAFTQNSMIDKIEEVLTLTAIKGGRLSLSLATLNLFISVFDVTMHATIKALVSAIITGRTDDFTASDVHTQIAETRVPLLSVLLKSIMNKSPPKQKSKLIRNKGGSKRHGCGSKRHGCGSNRGGNRLKRRGHKTTHRKKN